MIGQHSPVIWSAFILHSLKILFKYFNKKKERAAQSSYLECFILHSLKILFKYFNKKKEVNPH